MVCVFVVRTWMRSDDEVSKVIVMFVILYSIYSDGREGQGVTCQRLGWV